MAPEKPVETFAQFCEANARKRRDRRIALAILLPLAALTAWAGYALLFRALYGPSAPIDESEQRRVAVHEIGHVIVSVAVDPDLLLLSTEARTRMRTDGIRGVTRWSPVSSAWTSERVRDWLAISCGGRAADIVVGGAATSGASGDLADMTLTADLMHFHLGLGGTLAVKTDLDAADWDVIEAELQDACARAERIVAANKDLTIRLAKHLADRPVVGNARTLTGADIYMFMAELEMMPIEPPPDTCVPEPPPTPPSP